MVDSNYNPNVILDLQKEISSLHIITQVMNRAVEDVRKDNTKNCDSIEKIEETHRDDITLIRDDIREIKYSLEKLKANNLLEFTSEMGFKKVILIIVTLISVISSFGLIGNVAVNEANGEGTDDSEVNEKLERLIDLLDETTVDD